MRCCNHSNRRGCGVYLAALVAGILVAMRLSTTEVPEPKVSDMPLLKAFTPYIIIIAILVLLCFL